MIKLIATDMDGTWLNAKKSYNKALFKQGLKLMQQQGICFVIASGNQYQNIRQYFPDDAEALYFVAENGALVAKGSQVLQISDLAHDQITTMQQMIQTHAYPTVVAGLKAAYLRKSEGEAYYHEMTKYYAKIVVIDSFADLGQINDRLFKMSFAIPPAQMQTVIADMSRHYPTFNFVAGAVNSLDIQPKKISKAFGLKHLAAKLKIAPSEMIAFGDSGNDVAMLNYAGRSFVTATAMPEAKQGADEVIGASEESAVQYKIIELLQK